MFHFVCDQLFISGNNDSQSHCNATAFTTRDKTIRGKSLSPPKIGATRKQTIYSNAYLSRIANQRHSVRPFCILRKQKLILKAKQQARLSISSPSPTAMGKSIPPTSPPPPPKQTAEKPSEKDDKANSSESEYSSLEDDDDVEGNNKA